MILYQIAAPSNEADLALAEVRALVGGERISPHALLAPQRVDMERSAFIGWRGALLARSASFEELLERVGGLREWAEDFCVWVKKFPHRYPLASQEAAAAVGRRIGGWANLEHPSTEYMLLIDGGEFFLARIEQKNSHDWQTRQRKPFTFSSSLGPRMARALVNLVARPGQWIVDPCCGSGTIVIEAERIGVRGVGFDINRRMAWRSRENAQHFGIRATFGIGDVRCLAGRFDAVISDFPYGIFSHREPDFDVRALSNLHRLAPRAVILSDHDLAPEIETAGGQLRQLIRVPGGGVTRYVHVISFDKGNRERAK